MTKPFTEFEVYKNSIILAKVIFDLMKTEKLEKEYGFKDQIKRAVVSISNNIAEGSEYNNNKQFVRFLKHAKGSCAEVRSMLILSVELEFCSKPEIEEAINLSIEISKSLSKFIEYLKLRA